MLLTKREETLLKAFLDMGKLSLKDMEDILQVSRRTVYRILTDLTESLKSEDIQIHRINRKFFLQGDLSRLDNFEASESYSPNQRLQRLSYLLLTSQEPLTNEDLQEEFLVSNVTVIQDIALIEARFAEFNLSLERKRGYQLLGDTNQKRRIFAILLTNLIAIADFWSDSYADYPALKVQNVQQARHIFEKFLPLLGDIDPKLKEFLIILLALSDNSAASTIQVNISKSALDFSQKVFTELAQESKQFYNLQEIISFAAVLDEVIIKRQEVPLFRERFDSEFFYNVSQLIDSVTRYTKIEFIKDPLLFTLLFNHLRLSLAVPILFPEQSATNVAYLAAQRDDFLHSVVSLLVKDIFPTYIQNEYEYELITLHFASSLRRSPDIYPIRILLLTDERPLTTSVLISRIKNIAPFVELIDVKSTTSLPFLQLQQYDYVLTTRPIPNQTFELISTFPDTKEMLELQETLQGIQENRRVAIREEIPKEKVVDLQTYLKASSHLLTHFQLLFLDNASTFEAAVRGIIDSLDDIGNNNYLADKILSRFEVSPLAIPNTNLALIHTQSSQVEKSQFAIVELAQPVSALAMNHQEEEVRRILVMLTKIDEDDAMRELLTAISQSIIENTLYTEIYRTGNQEIVYQLLNTIFSDKIKKLEN